MRLQKRNDLPDRGEVAIISAEASAHGSLLDKIAQLDGRALTVNEAKPMVKRDFGGGGRNGGGGGRNRY